MTAFPRCLFVGLFLCLVGLANAQPGELRGFSFLRMEPSARSPSLGGSYSAMYGDDINTLFYNPALLNESMHRVLSVSFLNHVSDLRAGFLAYGLHLDRIGSIGFGLRFLSWGKLVETDAQGNELGNFSANDVAFTVGVGRSYTDRLYFGANVNAIFSNIESYSASALALDLGGTYLSLDESFAISASVNNLGLTLNSFGATHDDLPLDFRLGVSKRLAHLPLLLTATGYNLHDYQSAVPDASTFSEIMQHVAFGGEFQFSESFNLRFGYNHRRHETLKAKSRLDFAGFGFGVGIKVSRVRFDYGFNSWSSFGGLHQFTLRTVI